MLLRRYLHNLRILHVRRLWYPVWPWIVDMWIFWASLRPTCASLVLLISGKTFTCTANEISPMLFLYASWRSYAILVTKGLKLLGQALISIVYYIRLHPCRGPWIVRGTASRMIFIDMRKKGHTKLGRLSRPPEDDQQRREKLHERVNDEVPITPWSYPNSLGYSHQDCLRCIRASFHTENLNLQWPQSRYWA